DCTHILKKEYVSRHPAEMAALFWPWDEEWWKPKSARENLVRAGALVLAEIERLDRSATEQGSTCCKGSA
ncbi:hypothetical protein ACLBWA_35920, partial [Pseudomonas aeruginosa]